MRPIVRRRFAMASCLAVVLVALAGIGAAQQAQPQRPPFRTSTNLVRVDAYPTKDGRIIPDLKAEDFELLEDGVPQKIESFEYVEYPQNSPLEARKDPNSQREGFELAADPTYRVFVVYLDNLHVDFKGSHAVRRSLIMFLDQVLGPKDLFGVMTTLQDVKDLMLGQQTLMIEEQLTKYWDWGTGARVTEDEEDLMIRSCFAGQPRVAGELVTRRRLDAVFSDLDALVLKLGDLRDERKNILLVSNGWALAGRAPGLRNSVKPMPPGVGVTDAGKLTLGRTDPHSFDPRVCEDFLQRLGDMDFNQRQRDLLQEARRANVTFYAIKPNGLVAPYSEVNGRVVLDDRAQVDSLLTLANNTDGIAVVNTNDLTTGARRIAQDLSAVYLLGYYPTNSKPDGRIRKITVRLKPGGSSVRARREYRAPSETELNALRAGPEAAVAPASVNAPVESALSELKRLRPGAVFHSRGTVVGGELLVTAELTASEIEAGHWREGGEIQAMVSDAAGTTSAIERGKIGPGQRSVVLKVPVRDAAGPFSVALRFRSDSGGAEDALVVSRSTSAFADPQIYRGTTPANLRPAGSVQFRRTERLRARWPIVKEVGKVTARILGRDGVPLELQVTIATETDGGQMFAVADLNLAPLTAGEYLLEVSGTAEGAQSVFAFRVTR